MWSNSSYGGAWNEAKEGPAVWVLWRYEPDEWAQFIAKDRARVSRGQRWWMEGILLFAGLMGILWGTVVAASNGLEGLICGILPLIWFGGIEGAWWLLNSRSKGAQYNKLKWGPHEVAIGPTQARMGDSQIELVTPEVALTRVWINKRDPTILRFRTEGIYRGTANEIWLPVPRGKEQEAEQLAERFRIEVIRPAGMRLVGS